MVTVNNNDLEYALKQFRLETDRKIGEYRRNQYFSPDSRKRHKGKTYFSGRKGGTGKPQGRRH